jgi:MFS superfamily sulfate permease-like transporter
MVTGLFVMIVLLCLTQVFLYMPNNAQGAIIISGIITLFDYKCVTVSVLLLPF